MKWYDYAFTSTEFYIIKWNSKVNQKFLYYQLFTDNVYNQFAWKTTWSTWRRRLDRFVFENIQIPLPPLKTQEKIVDKMDSALIEKKKLENKSEEILNSIDDYVLSELWIELEKQEEKMYFSVDFEDIKNWRFDLAFCKHMLQSKNIQWKYEIVKIKNVVQEIKTWLPIRKDFRILDWNFPYYWANGIIWYMNDFTHDWEYLVVSQDWYIWNHYVVSWKFWASNHNWVMKIKEWININYIKAILDITNYDYLITWWVIPKLTKESLEAIEIPLPPKEIQDKIANEVKNRTEKANQLKNQATEIYEQAKNEVEKMILE